MHFARLNARVLALTWVGMTGAAIAAAPPAAPRSAPATEFHAPRWRAGERFSYRVALSGTVEADVAALAVELNAGAKSPLAPQRQTSRVERAATLQGLVLSSTEAGVTAAARLSDPAFSVDGRLDQRLDLLGAPFIVAWSPTGEVREVRFVAGMPSALAEAIRGLVEATQVVLPEPSAARWAVMERTGAISTLARYERVSGAGADVELRRVRTQPTGAAVVDGRAQQHVLEGPGARIWLSPTGRLVRLESHEKLTTTRAARFVFGTAIDLEVVATPAGAPTLPTTLGDAEAQLASTALARAHLADVEPALLAAVQGKTPAQAIAEFDVRVTRALADGTAYLRAYLKVYPASSAQLAAQLDAWEGRHAETPIVMGWAALAQAGHAEAQQTLRAAMSGAGFKDASVERALMATLSVQYPQLDTARAVWALREREEAGRANPLRLSIAANVYGALGHPANGDPAVTAEVVRTLTQRLAAAPGRTERDAMLAALGNVGDFSLVGAAVAPFFTSPEPSHRAHAYRAFHRMEGARAFEVVAGHFATETSNEVRRAALRAIESMPDSPERLAWVREQARRELDPTSLRLLVGILGNGRYEHPENLAHLSALLEGQRDRSVRRAIYTFVAPNQGGRP